MTDTSAAMVTTPAEPGTIATTQPPYYFPTTGPDVHVIRELTLYVSRRLEAIYLVRVKGPSLRPPATFEIHRDQTAYTAPEVQYSHRQNGEQRRVVISDTKCY